MDPFDFSQPHIPVNINRANTLHYHIFMIFFSFLALRWNFYGIFPVAVKWHSTHNRYQYHWRYLRLAQLTTACDVNGGLEQGERITFSRSYWHQRLHCDTTWNCRLQQYTCALARKVTQYELIQGHLDQYGKQGKTSSPYIFFFISWVWDYPNHG